jgi:ABC-type glycerol-3-phosphate transport system permease component
MNHRHKNRQIAARLGLYAFLLAAGAFFLMPLYVMLVTSLKPAEEIRQGAMLALPHAPTLDAFAEAWGSACTGLDCRGISPGFVNSLVILVPSVVLSILLGAVNGYALAQWRFHPGSSGDAADGENLCLCRSSRLTDLHRDGACGVQFAVHGIAVSQLLRKHPR